MKTDNTKKKLKAKIKELTKERDEKVATFTNRVKIATFTSQLFHDRNEQLVDEICRTNSQICTLEEILEK